VGVVATSIVNSIQMLYPRSHPDKYLLVFTSKTHSPSNKPRF